ncbi:asparaginase domain-containing protein [Halomonas organivorans]|uniref:asparaginase n=1 Tax=Halomonas organivorans TaxID=257772 RepID=A0A7W5G7L4_9GAMM|nr:asparaginase domain-containing protein [Halomonas organivorans]MBB3143345.1 L-asparaginase [Halomonas organivorans]
MRRLLILHTGGTIGMRPGPDGYAPAPGFSDRLIRHLAGHDAGDLPECRVVELAPLIDSADLVPADWNRLVAALAEHWHDHDGFVILHGTDTLAHTASALSFMLGDLDKPVVLTGAQIPLGEPRSDASSNLATALLAAANDAAPREVSIAFHDRLLRGNRARKVRSQGFDAFDSPNVPWLGEAGITLRLDTREALPTGTPDFTPLTFAENSVALLPVHPGLSTALLDAVLALPTLQGLVLTTYGVGNPPGLDGALIARLARATRHGLAVLNVTQCHQGCVEQGAYATGAALNAAGVIPGGDLTPEAALAKLQVLIARGLGGDALATALATPLRGEMSAG